MKNPDPTPGKASGWLPGLIFTGALAGVSIWIAQAWLTPTPRTPLQPQPELFQQHRQQPPALALADTQARQPTPVTAPLSAEKTALLAHPSIHEYVEQLAKQQSLQQFFASAEGMTLEQRQHKAALIREDLRQATKKGEASASERLLVELALLPLTLEDDREREEARITLQQHYQDQHDQAMARWQDQSGPQLDAYREQQQRIIAQVMAREDFASDQKRERYLQQQLQLAREKIYGQNPE